MLGNPEAKLILAAERVGQSAFTSMEADLGKLKATATVVGAAAAAALTALTVRSFESIDALAKVSDRLNVSTQALAAFHVAGDLAGVGGEELDRNLQKMTRTIAEAAVGTGAAKDELRALGLDARQLAQLPLDEQFRQIASRIGEVDNASQQLRISIALFGREGAGMVNLMREGSEAFDEARAFAERFGLAVSRVDAAKIEQANDAAALAMKVFEGLGNIIAVEVAPYVTGIANAFLASGVNAQTMGSAVRMTLDGIVFGIGLVMDSYRGWELAILQIRTSYVSVAASIVELEAGIVRGAEEARDKFLGIYIDALDLAAKVDPLGIGKAFGQEAARGIAEGLIGDHGASAALSGIAESFRATSDDSRRTLENLAGAEMPSAKLARAMATARQEAQRLAEATAAAVGAPQSGGIEITATDEAGDRKLEQQRAQLLREFEAVRQGMLSKEEMEREAIARRQEILKQSYDMGLVDLERYNQLSADVYVRGQKRLAEIEKAGWTEQQKWAAKSGREKTATVLGEMVTLTAGVAQHHKVLFNINKAAAIAQAILTARETIPAAYKWGVTKGGPILGAAMAAIAGVAQFANVQAIMQTSFEGGGMGTTPSSAGSVPVVNDQPVQQNLAAPRDSARGGVTVNVNVSGNVIGAGGKAELGEFIADALRDHVDRTDDVVINLNSRQGQLLTGHA